MQLLRKTKKTISETKAYNSATTNQTIIEANTYYVTKSGQTTQIKKDKKSVLALLSDKTPQLEEFIKQNKLNLKQDGDLSKLIIYYNNI